MLGNTNGLKHRLLPEAPTSLDGSDSVDNAKSQDALNRARNQAKSQGLGIVFVPRLNVKRECSYNQTVSILCNDQA